MNFSVLVDNEPKSSCGKYSCNIEQITHCLYEYICTWDFNVHGTVEPTDEEIIDNSHNRLNTKKIIMNFNVFVDDEPLSDCGEYSYNIDQITNSLYEHICKWEFNVYESVDVIYKKIINDVEIGVD